MSYVMPLPASPEATLPIMAMGSPRVSWGSALEASTAAGLDFSGFVGEEVQIVTYFVQRDPALPPVRMLRLAVLLHGDDVIGAWYMADGERRAYSLTELDELNGLSLEYQLPPENVVPTSAIVNVAEFYELAQTETFQLCWPECSDVPVTVRFRDALVAALTADLELLSIDSHPYPRSAEEMVQTPWRYAALNFGYADGGWITRYFLYDREAGLILLPSGAGWVHAPAAFVELMATVGPP